MPSPSAAVATTWLTSGTSCGSGFSRVRRRPAPNDTLELAQLADVSGLDLFTVQDHPYNATHLDASTLLTAVAARTSTIRVAHNVANLPLRPPVGLAKRSPRSTS